MSKQQTYWLIKQVELYEECRADAIALHRENHRYKQALEEILIVDDFEDAIDYAEKVVEIVTQALKEEYK